MEEPKTLATMFRSANFDSETVADSHPGAVDLRTQADRALPRYEVRSILGRGGMGEVRLCRDGRIGRDVAVKVAHTSSEAANARFLREARVQAQLEHPAIVPVHDVEVLADGSAYFVMKRVRGVTLSSILKALKQDIPEAVAQYPLRKLLAAFNSVCLAVDFAHHRGVVHRDIKPGNIMLGDFGEVCVLDWGLAKLVAVDEGDLPLPGAGEREARAIEEPDSRPGDVQTMVGTVLGTPGYMAPEQVSDGASVGPAADIYSLGVVLFEILALEPLIATRDAVNATLMTVQGVDPRPSVRAPTRAVPPELDAICAEALAHDPSKRFATARALHDAVDRYLAGEQEVERRRALSRLHLEAAEASLRGIDTPAVRAHALRELGSALAVDHENAGARRRLLELLTAPPATPPPEAQQRIAADRAAHIRDVATLTVLSQLTFPAFAIPALLVGVHDKPLFLSSIGLICVSTVLSFIISRSREPSRAVEYTGVILALLGHVGLAGLAGPLMVFPALLAGHAAATQVHPDRARRLTTLIGCSVVMSVAFLPQALGLVDSSYAFVDDGLLVKNHIMRLDSGTLWFFFAVSLGTIVVPAMFIARTRAAQTSAERSLHVQRWQLEQLVAKGS